MNSTPHDEEKSPKPRKPAPTPDAELVRRTEEALERLRMPRTDLAAELEVDKQAVNRWLNASRCSRKDLETIEPRVTEWLRERDQLDSIVQEAHASRAEYLETPTLEKIVSALAWAKAHGDMLAVYGAPGVGKTTAIKAFAERYPNVWHATIEPASASVVPALEEIAESCGLKETSGGARRLSRAIAARVRDLQGLLIVDECQHLTLSAVEQLRAIHDATGVGLALVGNELSYARLTGGVRAANYAQIFSRLGMRLHIAPPGRRDVVAVASRYHVRDEKSLDLLERIAQRPGGLRSVVKVVRSATDQGTQAPSFERLRSAVLLLGAEE